MKRSIDQYIPEDNLSDSDAIKNIIDRWQGYSEFKDKLFNALNEMGKRNPEALNMVRFLIETDGSDKNGFKGHNVGLKSARRVAHDYARLEKVENKNGVMVRTPLIDQEDGFNLSDTLFKQHSVYNRQGNAYKKPGLFERIAAGEYPKGYHTSKLFQHHGLDINDIFFAKNPNTIGGYIQNLDMPSEIQYNILRAKRREKPYDFKSAELWNEGEWDEKTLANLIPHENAHRLDALDYNKYSSSIAIKNLLSSLSKKEKYKDIINDIKPSIPDFRKNNTNPGYIQQVSDIVNDRNLFYTTEDKEILGHTIPLLQNNWKRREKYAPESIEINRDDISRKILRTVLRDFQNQQTENLNNPKYTRAREMLAKKIDSLGRNKFYDVNLKPSNKVQNLNQQYAPQVSVNNFKNKFDESNQLLTDHIFEKSNNPFDPGFNSLQSSDNGYKNNRQQLYPVEKSNNPFNPNLNNYAEGGLVSSKNTGIKERSYPIGLSDYLRKF